MLNVRHTGAYLVSILYKYIAGRYRPVRVADGPITARYRFIKNASWVLAYANRDCPDQRDLTANSHISDNTVCLEFWG